VKRAQPVRRRAADGVRPVFAQSLSESTVRVGGQSMFPNKTIVANAANPPIKPRWSPR
jgi:hypothetical protein